MDSINFESEQTLKQIGWNGVQMINTNINDKVREQQNFIRTELEEIEEREKIIKQDTEQIIRNNQIIEKEMSKLGENNLRLEKLLNEKNMLNDKEMKETN
jgi:nicotinamide mononucleotide adenylyltransferase